jgi:hypothetical protein
MAGLNTISEAWERTKPRQDLLKAEQVAASEAAFYAGCAATLSILRKFQAKPTALTAVMDSLTGEISDYLGGHTSSRVNVTAADGFGERTFRIPWVGQDADAAGRVTAAIVLARPIAERMECMPLLPWLIEALQYALFLGMSEDALRDDLAADPDWWHSRMHAGLPPKEAAEIKARRSSEEAPAGLKA